MYRPRESRPNVITKSTTYAIGTNVSKVSFLVFAACGKRFFNMSWMYIGTSMDTMANSRDTHIFSTPAKKT